MLRCMSAHRLCAYCPQWILFPLKPARNTFWVSLLSRLPALRSHMSTSVYILDTCPHPCLYTCPYTEYALGMPTVLPGHFQGLNICLCTYKHDCAPVYTHTRTYVHTYACTQVALCPSEYYYRPTPWAACSTTCGERGMRSRTLECARVDNKPEVQMELCRKLPMVDTVQVRVDVCLDVCLDMCICLCICMCA